MLSTGFSVFVVRQSRFKSIGSHASVHFSRFFSYFKKFIAGTHKFKNIQPHPKNYRAELASSNGVATSSNMDRNFRKIFSRPVCTWCISCHIGPLYTYHKAELSDISGVLEAFMNTLVGDLEICEYPNTKES